MRHLSVFLSTANIVEGGGQDLFNEAWTKGDLNAISDIVGVLGNVAMSIISFVGFAIVVFSILKNALSGLYVVNPQLWDQVDELKKAGTNLAEKAKSGNVAVQKLGAVSAFILSALPNVKDLTDFADPKNGEGSGEKVIPDKKQYFMKAIPLLVVQIFIGMLIFFGYPSKIANWIGTGATYAIDVVIDNADPVTLIQSVSDSFVNIKLATDGSNDPWENAINKATREMVSVVNTQYNDILKESLQTVAYEIESNLQGKLGEQTIRDHLASNAFQTSITATYYPNLPKLSDSYKPISGTDYTLTSSTATNGEITYMYYIAVDSLSHGSQKTKATDYLVWRIKCTPVAITNSTTSNIVVYGGSAAAKSIQGYDQISLGNISYGTAEGAINGSLGTCSVILLDASGNELANTSGKLERVGGVTGKSDKIKLVLSKDTIKNANGVAYMLIYPNSSFTVTEVGTDKITYTYNLSHLKVKYNAEGTSVTYALTSWLDYSEGDESGTTIKDIHSKQNSGASKSGTETP